MAKRFQFQGKSYDRWEDLPPEAQEAYRGLYTLLEDQDRDGVPDALQGRSGSLRGFVDEKTLQQLQNMPRWMKVLYGKLARWLAGGMPPPSRSATRPERSPPEHGAGGIGPLQDRDPSYLAPTDRPGRTNPMGRILEFALLAGLLMIIGFIVYLFLS